MYVVTMVFYFTWYPLSGSSSLSTDLMTKQCSPQAKFKVQ